MVLDDAWNDVDAALLQLGSTWQRKALPVIDLDATNGRLLLAAGPSLHITDFDKHGKPFPLLAQPEQIGKTAVDDITGLAAVPGRSEIIVGTLQGALKRLNVTAGSARVDIMATYGAHASLSAASAAGAIQALAVTADLIATASTPRAGSGYRRSRDSDIERGEGQLSLYTLRSPWQPPTSIPLQSKPWSLQWQSDRSLALGHTGESPLSLYTLTPSGIDPHPRHLSGPTYRSAVYAFAPYPSSTAQDDLVLSGWYDGIIRLHDLRLPDTTPVLELGDQWSEDAIYSLATSPHLPHTVIAGVSRHSALKIADLRAGRGGVHTTLFAAHDSSPLYTLALDGKARVFGATEKRALMLDLKPGAVEGWWSEAPPWAKGARPRYARAKEALRLRWYGDEAEQASKPARGEASRGEERWARGGGPRRGRQS